MAARPAHLSSDAPLGLRLGYSLLLELLLSDEGEYEDELLPLS
jgi:hypothetical protein